MKSTIFNLSILFGLLICSQSVFAQYDDVYYDPSKFQEDHYKFEKNHIHRKMIPFKKKSQMLHKTSLYLKMLMRKIMMMRIMIITIHLE